MATVILGEKSVFETVGSSVEIGDYKTSVPVGATVNFHDTSTSELGKTYFTSGTTFGNFVSANSTQKDGTASGSVSYKTKPENVVYTMQFATSSEPIDTHPNFSKFAGDVEEPLHGAIFDNESGVFQRFAHTLEATDLGTIDLGAGLQFGLPVRNAKGDQAKAGEQNWYAGVSSYLEASGKWTKSFKSRRAPTLQGLGKISIPAGAPPMIPPRTWLYTGFSASFTSPAKGDRKRKIEADVTQEWTLSGRRGWDVDIYGEKPPEAPDQKPVPDQGNFAGVNNFGDNAGPIIGGMA